MSRLKDNIGWWIYCDIDGRGKKWRLAVRRTIEDYAKMVDGLYFPVEDFEDYDENYVDEPRRIVTRPTDAPESEE